MPNISSNFEHFATGRNPDKEMRTHSGRKLFIDNKELDAAMNNVDMEASNEAVAAGRTSFADLRRQKARDQFHASGININYMENEKEDVSAKPGPKTAKRQSQDNNSNNNGANAGWGGAGSTTSNQHQDNASTAGDIFELASCNLAKCNTKIWRLTGRTYISNSENT